MTTANHTKGLWSRFCESMVPQKEELQQRGKLCQELWPDACRLILGTADELLQQKFLFRLPWDMEQTSEPVCFQGEIQWDYQLNGDPEFIFQMNRHRNWICLGQAYQMTGNEAYAQCFVHQMMDWLKKEPFTQASRATTWRSLEAGLRADYWVRAMALCAGSPAVTEEVIAAFFAGLEVHAQYLVSNPRGNFAFQSNWGVMENTGLYVLSQVFDRSDWREHAVSFLRRTIAIQVMQDGNHWEASPMYHNDVLMSYLEVLHLAQIWGDAPFTQEDTESIFRMARATMLGQTPNGHQSMTGDSDDTDVRDLVSQAALLLHSGELKAGGFQTLDFEGIWMCGTEGFRTYQQLPTEQLPAGLVNFPWAGQVFWRSGWDENADWLHFRNGPLGGGHGHADKLHLDLWLNGEEVLLDCGRGTYLDVPVRYELKEAKAHNVPVAGGNIACQCESTWVYKSLPQTMPTVAAESGQFLFLEGYFGGYLPKGPLIQRRVVSVNADVLAICDEILADGETELAQYYHFGETIRLNHAGHGLEGRGEKCAFMMQSFCHGDPVDLKTDTATLARHYNHFTECPRVIAWEPKRGMVTTLLVRCRPGETVTVKPQQVQNMLTGALLSWQNAEGYTVETETLHIGLVFLHHDAGNDEATNGIQGVYGLGRTMACNLRENPLAMTTLQW